MQRPRGKSVPGRFEKEPRLVCPEQSEREESGEEEDREVMCPITSSPFGPL